MTTWPPIAVPVKETLFTNIFFFGERLFGQDGLAASMALLHCIELSVYCAVPARAVELLLTGEQHKP